MDKVKAYKEILAVLNKNDKLLDGDHQIDVRSTIQNRLEVLSISEMFDINLGNKNCVGGYIEITEYQKIMLMGEKHNRTISWSDNGKQPVNQRLYKIGFPTGAYIFGDHYPTETFKDFWGELKSFEPEFADTANHCLYFNKSNAKAVHEAFNDLFRKYKKIDKDTASKREIEELEKRLGKLKATQEA